MDKSKQETCQEKYQQIHQSILEQLEKEPSLISNYAKKSCRHCYGRGYEDWMQVGSDQTYRQLCRCADKSIRREVEDLVKS